jgi:hypothetical protein
LVASLISSRWHLNYSRPVYSFDLVVLCISRREKLKTNEVKNMEKRTIVGLIAIVSVVVVLIFAGALYTEEKPPASVSTQESVSTQDLEFLKWASETSDPEAPVGLANDEGDLLVCLDMWKDERNALKKEGLHDRVEFHAERLYDDAKKALDEIDQFSVSPELQPCKDEYKLALQDLMAFAYFAGLGVRTNDPDDMKIADECFESSGEHFESSWEHFESFESIMLGAF